MAKEFPHFFGGVRRKRRKQANQRLQRLPDDTDGLAALSVIHAVARTRRAIVAPAPRRASRRLLAEAVQLVDQFHHRGDGRIELLALLDVDRDPADRVVRLAPDGSLRLVQRPT